MAGIDIFSVAPSVVSRNLSGKSFFIYGGWKTGKTSNAVKFPKPIVLGFEKGWNMISGVIGQPLNKWSEALTVKKQLLQDVRDVEEGRKTETTFKTVVVDTADLAYVMCEDHILIKEGVEYLDETESKRGYKAVEREFDKFFQEIVKAGYTLVAISHSEEKQVKENGEKFEKTVPTLDKRGLKVLSRLADVNAYAGSEKQEDGSTKMMLFLRGDNSLQAGSRSKYMSDKVPFTYDALLADMEQAIDKLEKEDGAKVTDKATEVYSDQSEELNFDDIVAKIKVIALSFNRQEIMNKYTAVTNKHLGKGKTVKECDETQTELLGLILSDLNDIIKSDNIIID